MEQIPPHVYKIISLSHWQATQKSKTVRLSGEDHERIQFAKEDQLEILIEKDWAHAPQYVILKIDCKKLIGTWNVELDKSIYLDGNAIPVQAILEAKIVYRQSPREEELEKLTIVETGDPVLRQRARKLLLDEIQSTEIQTLIEQMKATMRAAPGVGLAAPQIGRSIQLLVVEDMDQSHLTPQQIAERERSPVPFHVLINPELTLINPSDQAEFFEGCLSVPEFIGVVPRAKSIRVDCLNERGEPTILQASGWYARILQHEIDHLFGTLFIDRVQLPTLITAENYDKLHKHKGVKEIQDELLLNRAF